MRWLARWRPALRIARRDAWQHKGRSLVVLVMVALPVLAVVALDTLARTADVSTVEGLDRQLGAADAQVQFTGAGRIAQIPTDPSSYRTVGDSDPGHDPGDVVSDPAPGRRLAQLLPEGTRVIEVLRGTTPITTDVGQTRVDGMEVDATDPMTRGLYRMDDGRAPRAADEVAVSRRLADRGFRPGTGLTLADGQQRRVVGVVSWLDLDTRTRLVVAPPGSLDLAHGPSIRWWLVDAPAQVSWPAVKALNAHGYTALSRAVVDNPPPDSQVSLQGYGGGTDSATLAVIGLIVAMALIEVVLLAGPAFAVGIRRQQRSLALLTATGGRPRDVRRVVLGGGLVLGGVASMLGVVGGLVVARLAQPGVQRFSTTVFGPFDVSVRDVLLVAGFGLLSALLAAVVPAFVAARLDVVAVLAGRRGQTRAPRWSPILGLALLGVGVAVTMLGATRGSGGETFIAGGAIPAVLGMVLLVPLVVSQLGHAARLLPLSARFAVRDAARHRSRTAPAVAAVAATVAGVVALGIGGASDAAQSRATYTQRGPLGAAVVGFDTDGEVDWPAAERIVHKQVPPARVRHMLGVAKGSGGSLRVSPVLPAGLREDGGWSNSFGASLLVGEQTFDAMGLQVSEATRSMVSSALRSGKVVLFTSTDLAPHVSAARLVRPRRPASGHGGQKGLRATTVPAVAITAPGDYQPAQAVVPESVLAKTGLTPVTTALVVDGVDISTADEDALSEALGTLNDEHIHTYVTVERGYHDNSVAVALLLLGCVGGVLVLGGTLTATFLALSDARPDFATMGAVGAAPRTRRMVAASYAATIGLVGAVLGAVVGFVPGIAVTYPLTASYWAEGTVGAGGAPIADHFLHVPWLLVIGVVLGLPLLTAAVVGLASRSRLPMVSRLS